MAAISRELAGSKGIWGGITVVAPATASGIHHHGEIRPLFMWCRATAKCAGAIPCSLSKRSTGRFYLCAAFCAAPGDNPSPDTATQWVIVRNSQEQIVVNFEPMNASQQQGNDVTHNVMLRTSNIWHPIRRRRIIISREKWPWLHVHVSW